MQDSIGKLRARLRNWGLWLCHDADIGPKYPKCVSIESTHVPELGDVHADEICSVPIPNVADAERLNAIIQRLDHMERFCLSMRYGGTPAVFRMRRIGDHMMVEMADRAELMIYEWMKKRA